MLLNKPNRRKKFHLAKILRIFYILGFSSLARKLIERRSGRVLALVYPFVNVIMPSDHGYGGILF